jgi:hypothetical protein
MPEDLKLQPQVYEPQGFAAVGPSTISGTVTDQNGAVIPNASVTLRSDSTGQTYTVYSDASGNFSQFGLPGGSYSITANASGFNTMVIRGARPGRSLYISLQIGSVSSTVEVTADQVAGLPAGTGFSSLLRVQPSSSASNNFIVDGASTSVSDALTSRNSGVVTAATGEEIGDLFEYRIDQPVTVTRDRSALIPIIQTQMDG